MDKVVVVSDWDADGIVAAAEIVYSQEFLGLYPLRGKATVTLIPSSPRSFSEDVGNVEGSVVVILDIAFSKNVAEGLRHLRNRFSRVIYIDHHLSTIAHVETIERVANEVLIGKVPTAVLVAHIIRSLGGKLSPRLSAFVSAISIAEKGGYAKIDRRLVEVVVKISRHLSMCKDRQVWESIVRWLASPISMSAMPFQKSIHEIVDSELVGEEVKRVRAIAMELAPGAMKLANLRIVDARKFQNVKLTALASQLYRVLKLPVIVIGAKRGKVLLVIRARSDLPQRLALKLYEMGVLKDVGGHQSLAVGLLDPKYGSLSRLREALLRALLTVEKD